MATMLDISSLPSLEKFDSTLLDRLLRANTGEAPLPILDEQQAPDSEAALQRLMAGSQACCPAGQTSSPAPQPLLPQTPHAVVPPTPFSAAAGCPSPHGQTAAAHAAAGVAAPHLAMSFGALGSFPMTQSDIAAAAAAFAMPESMMGGGNGVKRKNRGARMDELIKAEDDGVECPGTSEASLTNDSSQAPSNKRRRNAGRDDTARSGMTMTAPMDETDSRARVRREKNRIAARKCRAKKVQFMADLQLTLRELMHKNEEYKLQVVTWHKMFSREVRLREAMKRIIAAIWQNGANPAAVTGCTANDVIIGLESGTLDVNTIVRALTAAPPTNSGGPAVTATAPTLATAAQEPSVGAPSIAGSSPQDASPLSGAGASFSAPAGKMAAAVAAGQLLPMQLSNVSDATGQLQATASEVFSGANGSAFAAMAAMPCAQ